MPVRGSPGREAGCRGGHRSTRTLVKCGNPWQQAPEDSQVWTTGEVESSASSLGPLYAAKTSSKSQVGDCCSTRLRVSRVLYTHTSQKCRSQPSSDPCLTSSFLYPGLQKTPSSVALCPSRVTTGRNRCERCHILNAACTSYKEKSCEPLPLGRTWA